MAKQAALQLNKGLFRFRKVVPMVAVADLVLQCMHQGLMGLPVAVMVEALEEAQDLPVMLRQQQASDMAAVAAADLPYLLTTGDLSTRSPLPQADRAA